MRLSLVRHLLISCNGGSPVIPINKFGLGDMERSLLKNN